MRTIATLWHVLVTIYRVITALWNAWAVLWQVIRSVIQEARQEAAELMLSDGGSTPDAVTEGSLVRDTADPENPWQMLIIARASSFVLLLRISKRRVLHLQVDERFIVGKLEVIRTEMTLHIAHVPRLLEPPLGMHDTRLVRYTPMKLPYLWKETARVDAAEKSVVSVMQAASVSAAGEGRSHRKKCVQLLTESAMRRRLRMGMELDVLPKKGAEKGQGVNVVKTRRRALANATNGATESANKEARTHGTTNENLNTNSLRKGGSLRRKRGQFELYAQGVSGEFSLLAKARE